jgi:hypothetical protein
MSSAVEEQVIYQIANAPVRDYPYPHLYVEEVFPEDFYAQLRANWPSSSSLVSLPETGRVSKGVYEERFVLPLTPAGLKRLPDDRRAFWTEFSDWLMAHRFLAKMVEKFGSHVHKRFGQELSNCKFRADALVVRDHTNYKIGPHTDAPHRLLSLLFYCPDDDHLRHLGTSIYVPLDPDFRCKGGPHHQHSKFQRIKTMEYKPNSLFAFFKTDNSFHGVEPIQDENILRDLLLYDIQIESSRAQAPAAPTSGVGMKMLRQIFSRSQ